MSHFTADQLYTLLPSIYRQRDEGQGGPLKALLAVIAEQAQVVEGDIGRLYNNWFIETCDEWLVPYIGDLLGVRGLGIAKDNTFSLRSQVANTISYRRRKGTATMLEQLAQDTTGWYAHAVEFFQYLSVTQNLNHLRLERGRTLDLRSEALDLLDTPFGTIARTAEARRPDTQQGRFNIPNIGLFLWRLQAYPMKEALAFSHGGGRFSFSPLGNDMQLFNKPQPEPDISHLAEEFNVPAALRRKALARDLSNLSQDRVYFGDEPVLRVDGYDSEKLVICDLSTWTLPEKFSTDQAAVDPELGRLAFSPNLTSLPTQIKVSYAYGFSGDLGGGPYDRRKLNAKLNEVDTVAHPETLGATRVPQDFPDLNDAFAKSNKTVIQIEDSLTYPAPNGFTIDMSGRTELVIQAANHQRPVLVGNLIITGGSGVESLALNGLLISGCLEIQGNLKSLTLVHCTLVPGIGLDIEGLPSAPGKPSIIVANPTQLTPLQLVIDHSIVGPLRLPSEMGHLFIYDSIIDSLSMQATPAYASGKLSTVLKLTAPAPSLSVSIGTEGPFTALLPERPATLSAAANALQAAINIAHDSLSFTQAKVVAIENRLVILPGVSADVKIEPVERDATAKELRLAGASAHQVEALRSQPIRTSIAPIQAVLASLPGIGKVGISKQVSTKISQTRISAVPQPVLPTSPTARLENRFMVIPTLGQSSNNFWHAIAADEDGSSGPPTTIECSTIFGDVLVKELSASESIFTRPVCVERHQSGCLRFCYLPDKTSNTPPRYRCQPDLELNKNPDATEREKERIRFELEPSFTANRYGDQAYAQLDQAYHAGIREGGENGAEMGAYNFLNQPQREANLRSALNEYLRTELVGGLFFAT